MHAPTWRQGFVKNVTKPHHLRLDIHRHLSDTDDGKDDNDDDEGDGDDDWLDRRSR